MKRDEGRRCKARALAMAFFLATAASFVQAAPDDSRSQDFAAAKALLEAGQPGKAKEAAERAWTRARADLPPDSPEQAAYARLAGAVRAALGDNAGADDAYGAALLTLENAYGATDPAIEPVVRALAIVAERRDRWNDAEAYYRRSLDLRSKQAGPDKVAVANGLMSLSRVLSAQGRDRAAEPPLLRALELRRATLGDAHPAILRTIDRLVALQLRIRRRDLAERWIDEALSIIETIKGPDTPDIATWLMRRAEIATADLRHDAARADLDRAQALRATAFGAQSPEVAEVLHQIGLSVLDEAEAAQALAQALVIRDATLPETHPALADSLVAVARRLDGAGDPGTALVLLSRALPIRAANGASASERAALLRDAGEYAFASGKPGAAAAHAWKSLELLESDEDSDPKARIASRLLFAEALNAGLDGDSGNPAVSIAHLRQAVAGAREAFGFESLEAAEPLEALASAYRGNGNQDLALAAIQEAIAIRRDRVGAWDPLLSDLQLERARICSLTVEGRPCAENAVRGAIQLRMDSFGIDDPRVADALELQADLFEAWGRTEAARAARERAATIRALARSWN